MSRAQLAALGLGRGAIEVRLRAGRLRPIHRGVYAVGHDAIPVRGRLVAALLVAGRGGALSHGTAAHLLSLTPSMPAFVEVTTTSRPPRNRAGARFHRTTTPLGTTVRHGLPLTTPLRTLRDLAATRPKAEVERACSEALVRRLVTEAQIAAQRGPGAAVLRGLVAGGVAATRSELERRFLRAVAGAGLPRPLVNHRIGPYVVDFAWPEHRLVVETDGARFHDHALARRRDRARDAELQLRGWIVLRAGWEEPDAVAARVARLLSLPASRRAS